MTYADNFWITMRISISLTLLLSLLLFSANTSAVFATEPEATPTPTIDPNTPVAPIFYGEVLYNSEKYRCVSCHGERGKGGLGPSFAGVMTNLNKEMLMKRAAHRCPPTGACNPTELGAIVDYIKSL
jgi:mono/diheme cytochrome c family protein